jgi:hypothetical protein
LSVTELQEAAAEIIGAQGFGEPSGQTLTPRLAIISSVSRRRTLCR